MKSTGGLAKDQYYTIERKVRTDIGVIGLLLSVMRKESTGGARLSLHEINEGKRQTIRSTVTITRSDNVFPC